MIYFFSILGYLIGSIPTGVILARLFSGVQLQKAGSGNIGATNVYRIAGKKLGILTLIGDVFKGILPLYIYDHFLKGDASLYSIAIIAFFTFLGHLFPIYLKFKGGKGVATALGIFLYLSPISVALCIPIFIIGVLISGYVSVGSLSAAIALPIWVFLWNGKGAFFILAILISILVIFKHSANIKRLMRGEEKPWRSKT